MSAPRDRTAPRPRRAALAATVCAFLLAACSSGVGDGDQQSTAEGPIMLGMLTPLSGSSAAIGPYMANGAQLAIDEINARGGVLGRQLRLVVEDDACDPAVSTVAAGRLVAQNVVASVGGYCSGATLPTLPIFDRAGIPMVIPAANSTELVDQKLKTVFLINGTGKQQAFAAAGWIEVLGTRRIALIDDETSYSADIAKRTDAAMGKYSLGTPVISASITPGEKDYTADIESVLAVNPDLIYWTGYYQDGGLLIRQLREAGYKGEIMVADGSVDGQLVQVAGAEATEGVFATMTQTPDTIAGIGDWVTRYEKAYDAPPGPFSTQSYDAVRVAAEAIAAAGSTTGPAVVAALEDIKGFPIFTGPLTFTTDHTLATGGFLILQVQGGQFLPQIRIT